LLLYYYQKIINKEGDGEDIYKFKDGNFSF